MPGVWAGGKIAFYSGLIERLDLTDDEMAAIMGHEISHALREHARERASQAMMTSFGVSVIGAALGVGQVGTDLIGSVAKLSFELPNSREHETEADRMGVELAARARLRSACRHQPMAEDGEGFQRCAAPMVVDPTHPTRPGRAICPNMPPA